MQIKNYDKIAELGGFIDNAEFVVMKCVHCGIFAIYDEENSFIYLNPKDLTQRLLYGLNIGEPILCPSCNKKNSFEEASDIDKDAIMSSEWAFIMT